MSKSLDNANEVIKRFGGLRPMANKLNVAVSTVQGWKKRNAIPDNRVGEVLKAAKNNNIDLSDLVASGINDTAAPKANTTPKSETPKVKSKPATAPKKPANVDARSYNAAEAVHKNNVKAGVIGTVAAALAITALGVSLFAFDRASDPANVDEALAGLEQQLANTNLRVNVREQALSNQISSFEQRVDLLDQELGSMALAMETQLASQEDFQQLLKTLDNPELREQIRKEAAEGETVEPGAFERMQEVVVSLQNNVESLQAGYKELERWAAENDITGADLRATAMLFVLSQFRSSFNRGTPFADDLAMLQKWLGTEDDTELQEAIARLQPYAERGVMTVTALKSELTGLSGDVLKASLQGQDVSLTERALARLDEVIRITKNGEPVAGSETGQTLANAQSQLDRGDVAAAVDLLKTLDPQAQNVLAPWFEQAQGTMAAGNMQDLLGGRIAGILGASGVQNMLGSMSPQRQGSIVTYGNAPLRIQEMPQQQSPASGETDQQQAPQ